MRTSTVFAFSLVLMLTVFVMIAPAEQEPALEPPSLFDFGLKAALSLPSFFWLEDAIWDGATSAAIMPAAYLFAAINITEKLALQIEAGYEGKGANIEASDGSLRWLFNYVQIPVILKYTVSSSSLGTWLAGGGYYAKFLGGVFDFDVPNSEWEGRSGSLTTGTLEDVTEIRPYDFGLVLSGGMYFGNILYEIRIPIGLTPVLAFTPADSDYGGYRKAVNIGVMLFLGYQF